MLKDLVIWGKFIIFPPLINKTTKNMEEKKFKTLSVGITLRYTIKCDQSLKTSALEDIIGRVAERPLTNELKRAFGGEEYAINEGVEVSVKEQEESKYGSVCTSIAKFIPLQDADFPNEDGETYWGGKYHADETLDEFIQMDSNWFFDEGEQGEKFGYAYTDKEGCTHWDYNMPIEIINKVLKECNIMPITDQDIENAIQDIKDGIMRK